MTGFAQVFEAYMPYGALALMVTVFATPLAANLARRAGAMDMPDRELKPHARPTPYLGGVAICLGWAVAAFAAAWIVPAVNTRVVFGIVAGGVAMSVLGLVDDLRELSPKVRLALSALIIVVVMVVSGVGYDFVRFPLARLDNPLIDALIPAVSLVLGLVVVLAACNSANLIDGLDGLCAGVTAIISAGFFLLASHLAIHNAGPEDNEARMILAIAMLGATVGFLPFNFNPAKIFMGDAGSMLLGFNCGMMILLFAERGLTKWAFGGMMIFALPLFDTSLAIVRRWRNGRPIFQGDRSHFYDQLVDRGYSVRRVVAISYVLSAIYALLGLAPIWLRTRYVVAVYAVVVVLTILLIIKADMVRVDDPATHRKPI
ncbi:MAG: undecaprenyl/decaprenyl-phosphate alpha-N-acetylglucosaminyl 1-phosphate transferase [Planctomycetota bacterium]|nr:MAG: undecaprenyl/decaprenyl-phosphate alpha-N-acetylglucosaminyl 1-phosphate transferase [Planctomycetota bacterium]